jgi:hypothetical protein
MGKNDSTNLHGAKQIMDIEKVLSLIGADKLAPELQGQVKELIEVLIEDPKNAAALERILFLLGVSKLDPDTQETVTENLLAVIDKAAKALLESIGKGEIERRKVKREYLSKVNESSGDAVITEYAKQRPKKVGEFKFDSGYGTDTMKENKGKISKHAFKWNKEGLSPLSGKQYGVQR